LTVHLRIFRLLHVCLAQRRSIFLSVRRKCSLAGTIFSSGFIVVQPDTGNHSLRRKAGAPGGFPSRGTLMQRHFKRLVSVSQVAHAAKPRACRAAVTSVTNELRLPDNRHESWIPDVGRQASNLPGFPYLISFAGKRAAKLVMAEDSWPKTAFSLSHVELNAIESGGQHFFS
jgi:hypothetical protein